MSFEITPEQLDALKEQLALTGKKSISELTADDINPLAARLTEEAENLRIASTNRDNLLNFALAMAGRDPADPRLPAVLGAAATLSMGWPTQLPQELPEWTQKTASPSLPQS